MKLGFRIFASLLSLIMILGLCSCKKSPKDNGSDYNSDANVQIDIIGGDDTSEDGSDDSNSSSDTSSDTSSGNSASQNNINLKGRVITVAMYGGTEVFTNSNEGIYAASFKEIAKKYNCKIKFETMPILDLVSKVEQEAMSHKSSYDIVQVEGYHAVPKNALSGQYICMSDYYDFDKDEVWKQSPLNLGIFEGKRYALPIGFGDTVGVYYNKKLVKAANLPDPWTYVNNDTWNWENFEKFAQALTKDTDGDGQPEQFGFTCEEPYLLFALTNNAQVIDTSTGHGKFALDSNNAKEALTYIQGLYNKQIIPTPEQYSEKGLQDAFHAMATGKAAMFTYNASYAPWLADEADLDITKDIGWVYFPKGPKAKDYVSPATTQPSMFMIPKYANAPQEIVMVLQDAMAYWSKNHKSATTVEETRAKNAQTDELIDFIQGNHLKMYQNLSNKVQYINALSYTSALDFIKEMLYDIRTGKYTVQAGLDAYKNPINQAIADAEKVE